MKRFSKRQRLLGGAFLVAAVVGVVDWYAHPGGPTKAQARSATVGSAASLPRWQDVDELLERLTGNDYVTAVDKLDQSTRDVFMPTRLIDETLGRAALLEPDNTAPDETGIDPEAEFVAQHQLGGVMLGSSPLAVVDQQLLPLNSDLDGYRLVEIQRDFVVFWCPRSDRRITLTLEQRPKDP